MKPFEYYSERYKSRNEIITEVFNEYNFNSDDYDSKSEEKRVHDRLIKIANERYNVQEKREIDLLNEFKQDLFEELKITDNPKKDLLFEKIWDDGYEGEFYAVYNIAITLIDLIK